MNDGRPISVAAPLVWFTGLSGAGKSTLARGVFTSLQAQGLPVELLDADQVRRHLCAGLGFTRQDREENVRRLGYVAGLLTRHGVWTLVAAMSPFQAGRAAIRSQSECFVEVFVDAPLDVCERRDPVSLYRRFRAGEIKNVSGLDELYEAPEHPEIHCRTAHAGVEQNTAQVMAYLQQLLAARVNQ